MNVKNLAFGLLAITLVTNAVAMTTTQSTSSTDTKTAMASAIIPLAESPTTEQPVRMLKRGNATLSYASGYAVPQAKTKRHKKEPVPVDNKEEKAIVATNASIAAATENVHNVIDQAINDNDWENLSVFLKNKIIASLIDPCTINGIYMQAAITYECPLIIQTIADSTILGPQLTANTRAYVYNDTIKHGKNDMIKVLNHARYGKPVPTASSSTSTQEQQATSATTSSTNKKA